MKQNQGNIFSERNTVQNIQNTKVASSTLLMCVSMYLIESQQIQQMIQKSLVKAMK